MNFHKVILYKFLLNTKMKKIIKKEEKLMNKWNFKVYSFVKLSQAMLSYLFFDK